jgi:hypothetical protein
MRIVGFAFGAVLVFSGAARADTIELAGGRVIEGEASLEGDKVHVLLESGRVSFAQSEVVRIEEGKTPLQEVRQREVLLAPRDAAGLLRLADYCREHDLRDKERELLGRLLAIDEDHAEARRRLGFVRRGDRWVPRDELSRDEQLARRQQQLSIEEREAKLREARAKLQLEREQVALERSEQRAQLRRDEEEHRAREKRAERAARAARNDPPLYAPYYGSPLIYAGPSPRLSPPSGPPAYGIPGVRHPSDMSFALPGVRPPSAYFEGALRR